jgi:3-oxoacyl-[acyl-carrier-protein] synthase II
MNWQEQDPDCDLDYVPNRARNHKVGVALNNAYAFGGNNSSLIFASCEV